MNQINVKIFSANEIYIAEGAENVSWPWLSPLRGWGSLTMTSTGKFVYIYIYTYIYIVYIYIYIYIIYTEREKEREEREWSCNFKILYPARCCSSGIWE